MTALAFWDSWPKVVGGENRLSKLCCSYTKLQSVILAQSGFEPGPTETVTLPLEVWVLPFCSWMTLTCIGWWLGCPVVERSAPGAVCFSWSRADDPVTVLSILSPAASHHQHDSSLKNNQEWQELGVCSQKDNICFSFCLFLP